MSGQIADSIVASPLLADWLTNLLIGASLLALLVAFVLIMIFASYFNLWIQSYFAGAKITFGDLIGMWFRRVNARVKSRYSFATTWSAHPCTVSGE